MHAAKVDIYFKYINLKMNIINAPELHQPYTAFT